MSQSSGQKGCHPAPRIKQTPAKRFAPLAAVVLIFFFGFAPESHAQVAAENHAKETAGPAIKVDSSEIALRLAGEAEFARFRSDPDFDYDRNQSAANTLWQKLYVWLFGNLIKALASSPMRPVWKILPYLVMGAALYLLASRLLKSQAQGLFSRTEASASLSFLETREDIFRTDFKERIEIAIREKKYRHAVRLLYLSSLRQLAQVGAIQWRLDKTNYDYLNELGASPAQEPFAELTRLFEYIWYGEFALDQPTFEAAHHKFRRFEELDWQDIAVGRK